MRSPHSTIPTIKATHTPTGWAVECSTCGLLDTRFPYRPGADLNARDHGKAHAPRRAD